MEQTIHTPEAYDFRKYDQIWQRVAPELEPYPDLRQDAAPAMAALQDQSPWERSAGTSREIEGRGAWGSCPFSMAACMAWARAPRS